MVLPQNAPIIVSDYHSMVSPNCGLRYRRQTGIDIYSGKYLPIISIENGIVLGAVDNKCQGKSILIDHGYDFNNNRLFSMYIHLGKILVSKGDVVERGQEIALMFEAGKNEWRECIGALEHLHFHLGSEVDEEYFLFPERSEESMLNERFSKNPHYLWSDGIGKVTCFDKRKKYREGSITYPVKCKYQN